MANLNYTKSGYGYIVNLDGTDIRLADERQLNKLNEAIDKGYIYRGALSTTATKAMGRYNVEVRLSYDEVKTIKPAQFFNRQVKALEARLNSGHHDEDLVKTMNMSERGAKCCYLSTFDVISGYVYIFPAGETYAERNNDKQELSQWRYNLSHARSFGGSEVIPKSSGQDAYYIIRERIWYPV